MAYYPLAAGAAHHQHQKNDGEEYHKAVRALVEDKQCIDEDKAGRVMFLLQAKRMMNGVLDTSDGLEVVPFSTIQHNTKIFITIQVTSDTYN